MALTESRSLPGTGRLYGTPRMELLLVSFGIVVKDAGMSMRIIFCSACGLFASIVSVPAAAGSGIADVGQGVAIAMPVVAGGISLYKDDYTGLAEMGVDTVLTVGTTYALSHIVREERPNHSDFHSFPSNTEGLAFAPAAYLWDRYGWRYGLPAYAAAGFVAYSRVDAGEHHWWDVVTSAAIGWTYSELFTTRFHPGERLSTGAVVTPNSAYVSLTYRW